MFAYSDGEIENGSSGGKCSEHGSSYFFVTSVTSDFETLF